MIGFNAMGHMGRLGNQMFQYAALLGIARRRGYDFVIPPPSRQSLTAGFTLGSVARYGYVDGPVVSEAGFRFDERVAFDCPDDATIKGYFQSERYFHDVADEVRADFSFRQERLDACRLLRDELGREVIAIHIRRTDYLVLPGFVSLALSYYERALAEMPDGLPVAIFSDDIEWCLAQELFADRRFVFFESGDPHVDLCVMSMCDHFVIANSTFSWWAAWLSANPSKRIVAPSTWFGDQKHDTTDLRPPSWTIV